MAMYPVLFFTTSTNGLIQAATFVICIREVPVSRLDLHTYCPELGFIMFLQFFQINTEIAPT
jgi:hypothetical protein